MRCLEWYLAFSQLSKHTKPGIIALFASGPEATLRLAHRRSTV
jgi:hypothetical protein